jgi:hypothetical protein
MMSVPDVNKLVDKIKLETATLLICDHPAAQALSYEHTTDKIIEINDN